MVVGGGCENDGPDEEAVLEFRIIGNVTELVGCGLGAFFAEPHNLAVFAQLIAQVAVEDAEIIDNSTSPLAGKTVVFT